MHAKAWLLDSRVRTRAVVASQSSECCGDSRAVLCEDIYPDSLAEVTSDVINHSSFTEPSLRKLRFSPRVCGQQALNTAREGQVWVEYLVLLCLPGLPPPCSLTSKSKAEALPTAEWLLREGRTPSSRVLCSGSFFNPVVQE